MPSRTVRSVSLMLILSVSLTTAYLATGAGDRATPAFDGAALYKKLQRACVKVLVDGHLDGSGCFVAADGLVLTAAHVVKGKAGRIEIISPVMGRLKAQPIAVDVGNDLALLRVDGGRKPYPWLKIAERMPAPTAPVLLFSSALWRHDLVLKGSVAKLSPSYCWQPGLRCYIRSYYIAGSSPVGSSGGCWVDTRGRVVGVQSGYLNNEDKSPVGIAFASPPDAIRKLLATKRSQEVATLGGAVEELWTQPPGFIARLPKGTQGIATAALHKDGPMGKAGLTKETIITAAEGKPVVYLDDLLSIVRSKKPGDQITLKVIEPIGKPPREVKVRLGKVK